MSNLTLTIVLIIICSVGGWYVVFNKYLELKAMVKNLQNRASQQEHQEQVVVPPADINDDFEDFAAYSGQHIPGMGPPPLGNNPFNIPEELLRPQPQGRKRAGLRMPQEPTTAATSAPVAPPKSGATATTVTNPISSKEKRVICNWATIMHLSGFSMLTGVPFVNILLPSIIWLLKKEEHNYLAKQGREIINFQITYTLLQFIFLGFGAMFVWLAPATAGAIFHWTKTFRVIFSTGMYLPFNLFTAIPFFWGCIVMLRGAVAAYHGFSYKYPFAQPFIALTPPQEPAQGEQPSQAKPSPEPAKQPAYNVSFG